LLNRSVLATYAGGAAQSLIQVAAVAFLARVLNPSEFGIAGIAILVVGFVQALSQLGLVQAIVQQPEVEQRDLSGGTVVSLVGGLFGLGVMALSAVGAATQNLRELSSCLAVLSLVPAVRALSVVAEGLTLRDEQFSLVAVIELTSILTGAVSSVICALYGLGAQSLCVGFLSQQVVRSAMFLCCRFPNIKQITEIRCRELLRFGVSQTIAQTANLAASEADKIIVAATLGTASVGTYGRAYQLTAAPANQFLGLLDRLMFPKLSRYQNDAAVISHAYRRAFASAIVLGAAFATLFWILAQPITLILLGRQWLAAVPPLQILGATFVLRAGFQISDSTCRAIGAVQRSGVRQVVYALAVITGTLVGSKWGVLGVAAGVGVAMLIKFVLMFQLTAGFVFEERLEAVLFLGKALLLAAIPTMCAALCTSLISSYDVGPLMTCVFVGAPTFICASWIVTRIVLRDGYFDSPTLRAQIATS
jgi:O-antigen/teichoic acid export membrane protein